MTASKSGVPDLLVCYKGIFIAIEVKRPSTKHNVSALQKYNLSKVKEAKGYGLVAWDLDMVKDFIGETDEALSTSN